VTPRSKACTKCGETKPRSGFHPDRTKKSGLRSWCRECQNAATAAYGKAHPEGNNRRTRAAFERSQARSIAHAANNGKEWTGPELELVADLSRSQSDIAKALGRTVAAVKNQRRYLRADPRKARMASTTVGEGVHRG
jgi:hypothetical protein